MTLLFKPFDRQKHLGDQRELYSLCFPESRFSDDESEGRYRWQFCDFPHLHNGLNSYEFVAFESGKMVGYYAAVPFRYRIDGEVFVCGMACDVMTHPKVRNCGIFKGIGKFATGHLRESGVHFTSAYPIRKEVIPGFLGDGWKKGFALPMFVAPLKSNALLRKMGLTLLSPLFNTPLSWFQRALGYFWKMRTPTYDVEILELSADSLNRVEEFLPRWESEQRFFLIKDSRFLQWRLGKKGATYQIALLKRGSFTVGVSILRLLDFYGIPSIALLDYMVLEKDMKASPRFLSEIKRLAIRKKLEAVVLMLSTRWSKQYRVNRAGYLKSPYVFRFISKKLNYAMDESRFLDEKNWHLSWIDSDRL